MISDESKLSKMNLSSPYGSLGGVPCGEIDPIRCEYTKDELDEFRKLVELGESPRQMDRIHARLDMPEFIKRVGESKCDIMYEVLQQELLNN